MLNESEIFKAAFEARLFFTDQESKASYLTFATLILATAEAKHREEVEAKDKEIAELKDWLEKGWITSNGAPYCAEDIASGEARIERLEKLCGTLRAHLEAAHKPETNEEWRILAADHERLRAQLEAMKTPCVWNRVDGDHDDNYKTACGRSSDLGPTYCDCGHPVQIKEEKAL